MCRWHGVQVSQNRDADGFIDCNFGRHRQIAVYKDTVREMAEGG